LSLAKSEDLYDDKESSFLFYADLGTLHYMKGEYYQALQYFDKAVERNKELYTVSVSKTVASNIVGDAAADYPGTRYEASLLRFYQSLCHYHLAKNGVYEAYEKTVDGQIVQVPERKLTPDEVRLHTNAARATVIDWNSLLTTYMHENSGDAVYKQDLLAKVWGAFIHEKHGSGPDAQIAKQLYRDVDVFLTRNYNMYPAFNDKWEKYVDDYKKLPQKKQADLKKNYIAETEHAKALTNAAKEAEKALKNKKNNVRVFMKTGLVGERYENMTTIPMDLAAIGLIFTDDPAFLAAMLTSPDIEISVPAIKKCQDIPAAGTYRLQVKNAKGKTVADKKMILVEPVTQIVCRDFDAGYKKMIAAKTARMTTKYAAALATAYAAKVAIDDDLWGSLAAGAAFSAAVAGINASEKADLRYWAFLPDNIWFQAFSLPAGTYDYTIERNDAVVHTGTLEVPKKGFALADVNLPAE